MCVFYIYVYACACVYNVSVYVCVRACMSRFTCVSVKYMYVLYIVHVQAGDGESVDRFITMFQWREC